MTDDNPYQSPQEPNVTAPWRQWYVWWIVSAVMFVVVAPMFYREPWSGGLLFFGSLGVSLRSLLELHRKFLAGCSIGPLQQLNSLGKALSVAIGAAVAGAIAFLITCTGMAIVTNAPFFRPPAGGSVLMTFVFGISYGAMVVTFFWVIWRLGPPSLEVLRRQSAARTKSEADRHE
ncbi:hypothetical protein [Blastopirellula retiformator]|uniref:Uncharacterized protein n=1 Tax=Blastopirellula retiformator TaxID=2527970 RepID=A0A5C5UZ37_9BACT|nr:hypothetical protein [Blastopirellula retiformator]TWT31491.1 hypothetical protein Enr8_34120 [Blastopirellula retiformator]